MASPRRAAGATSATTVDAAVGPKPMPMPWKKRRARKAPRPPTTEYPSAATAKTAVPSITSGRRPWRSASQPASGRQSMDENAKVPRMSPTAASPTPMPVT